MNNKIIMKYINIIINNKKLNYEKMKFVKKFEKIKEYCTFKKYGGLLKFK